MTTKNHQDLTTRLLAKEPTIKLRHGGFRNESSNSNATTERMSGMSGGQTRNIYCSTYEIQGVTCLVTLCVDVTFLWC